jgi:hypothetical protein
MTTQTLQDALTQLQNINGAPATTTTPTQPALEVDLGVDMQDTVDQFTLAREVAKQAEKLKKAAEAKLRAKLGDAKTGTINGRPVIQVNSSKNSHIDSDTLLAAFPEAYNATWVETPYTYLTPVK